MNFTCPTCGHADTLPDGPPPDACVFVCSECRTRVAFGKPLLREVVEPFVDECGVKWLRRRFQDPKTREDLLVVDIDREFAISVATNMLALVRT